MNNRISYKDFFFWFKMAMFLNSDTRILTDKKLIGGYRALVDI